MNARILVGLEVSNTALVATRVFNVREARRVAETPRPCIVLKGSVSAPRGCVYPDDANSWREIAQTGLVEDVICEDGVWQLAHRNATDRELHYALSEGWTAFALNGIATVLACFEALSPNGLISVFLNFGLIDKIYGPQVNEADDIRAAWIKRAQACLGDRLVISSEGYQLDSVRRAELERTGWIASVSPFEGRFTVADEVGRVMGEGVGIGDDAKDLCLVCHGLDVSVLLERLKCHLEALGYLVWTASSSRI